MRSTEIIAAHVACCLLLMAGCETQFEMKADMSTMTAGTGAAASGAGIGGVSGAAGVAPTAGTTATGGIGGSAGDTATAGTMSQAGSSGVGAQAGASAGTAEAGTGGMTGGVAGTENPEAGTGAPDVQTCPAASTLTPGETTETIQVGSATRSFILHVPASYTGETPVPLILDFHGILMSSGLQRAFSGYAELSETEGFIVAFPEGTDTAFNVGKCCTSSQAVDDIGFARAIVTRLSEQGCIDRKRVHSVGYSMGGGMSMHLACNAADVFASIATSAFDMMPEADWPCAPSRPISMITFRSTGDPLVPYNGAVDTIPPNGTATLVTFIGAEANFMKWAALNACTDAPQAAAAGCQLHSACGGAVAVELCTKQGGGHDYMDAAQGWAFLKQHPMP
jgi:polyhydroxybutyrate depolymerase